jgi:hypothetical protein
MRPLYGWRSSFQWALAVALLMVLGLVLLGCKDLGGTDITTGTVDTSSPGLTEAPVSSVDTLGPSTTTAPLPSTVTTEGLASSETRLSSGHIRAMGYISDVWVDGSGRHLSIDYADMLTDSAACTAAARRDGEIGPTDTWEFDWYISNVNPRLRTFDVSSSVAITTSTRWIGGDMEMDAPCTWLDFLTFWGPGPFVDNEEFLHELPWWIERDGNVIVKIDEQYLP